MITGSFTYLCYKYPECGFNERSVSAEELRKVFQDQGVEIIDVDRTELDKNVPQEKSKDFISYLCYGEEGIRVTNPVVFLDSSRPPHVKWFALAHEMGHFFLHPFLRDNMFNSNEIEKSKKKILGRFEMEADHFANMVFLPDRIINDHFERNVREALTKANSCDLKDLFVEIFNFCLEFTKQKLGIEAYSLPKRAILNLKFRSNRYVCRLREQLLISNYNFEDAFDLSLIDKNPFPKEDPFEQYLLNNGS